MAEKMTGVKKVEGGVEKIVIKKYAEDGVTLDADTWTLVDSVQDTTSITTEDGDITTILNEKGGVIKTISKKDTKTFTTNSGDIQENLLVGLMGYTKAADGELVAPNYNPEIYIQATLYFQGGNGVICHKIKLNPSVTLESLSSGIAQAVLTGTLEGVDVSIAKDGSDMREFGFKDVVPEGV